MTLRLSEYHTNNCPEGSVRKAHDDIHRSVNAEALSYRGICQCWYDLKRLSFLKNGKSKLLNREVLHNYYKY